MPDPSPTPEPVDAEIVPDPVPETAAGTGPAPIAPAPDYDERGVPGFDYVRARIEGRYATSLGTTELAADTPGSRSLDEQEAERDKAAKSRLDEIRRSLGN